MPDLALTKSEIARLTDAAARQDGQLAIPATMKATNAQRVIAKFLEHGLIAVVEQGGTETHRLAPAGYRAVGLEPPPAEPSGRSGSKRDLVVGLLEREEGASIQELIDVTGWLPHTTRAAVSRLRSRGRPVLKGQREDGGTVYRILAEKPKQARQARSAARGSRGRGGHVVASTPDRLAEDLDLIAASELAALRRRWRIAVQGPAPENLSRSLLQRIIAYRLQANALGDLDRETARALNRLARDAGAAIPIPARPGTKPGTLLVREWNGALQRVMVLEKGFAWNGQTFDSLSRVARAITATNWNGPRRFGLRQKAASTSKGARP